MCAIVDANVVAELWDDSGTAAGQHFRRWLEGPNGQLVVGGTLKRELGSDKAARFLRELDRAGKLTSVDDALVEGRTADLKRRPSRDPGCCKSNDHHIIALAQVSGAPRSAAPPRRQHDGVSAPGEGVVDGCNPTVVVVPVDAGLAGSVLSPCGRS